MSEGSCVGLDVHARSVVAGVIDMGSGEVRSLRVPPGAEATVAWLKTLPAPVRVVYEAGPTGYRLARACAAAGINFGGAGPARGPAAAPPGKNHPPGAPRAGGAARPRGGTPRGGARAGRGGARGFLFVPG